MAVTLYPHNQIAYTNVLGLLEESGKAAVIHPTGTGKSFIAFKLAEEHPGRKIIWLAPSEYIFQSQKENYLEAGGDESTLSGITFLTYSKLMYGRFEEEEPDYIILDEFHRCGAESWGKSVEELLNASPKAKVLGLSATHIRYLDNRRDMAKELFNGQIASQMELSEAIAQGILPAPFYICGLYEYKDEIKRIAKRVNGQRNTGVKEESKKLFDKLKKCLSQAKGPAQIFAKYMKKDGKYIVFCSGKEHMKEMIALAGDWFGGVDTEPNIYQAIYDNNETPNEVKGFCADNSSHLKLLFCVDMLNEGVHVPDVDGAVLLRPTASPTLYLQQVGRALAVKNKKNQAQPMIFDMVDNFDGLKCIDSFLEAYHKVGCEGSNEKHKKTFEFKLVDEVRESRELFERLKKALSSSWDVCFAEAEAFHRTYGNLKVPKSYITENGISLGSWLITQRRVRAGAVPGILTEEQIEKLDSLGMKWESSIGKAWERGYQELVLFKRQNGHVDVPSRYVTESGYPLGKFVGNQRTAWKNSQKKDAGNGRILLKEREQKLNELGFIWEKRKMHSGQNLEDGEKPFKSSYDLKWEERIQLAKHYYEEHGNLEVPKEYVVDGIRLGRWISAIRSTREHPESSNYRIDEERIRQLDSIGMRWAGESWEIRYRLAALYYQEHGDLKVSQNYVVEVEGERIWLGKWLAGQKKKRSDSGQKHAMSKEQEKRLEEIGMEW